jgi:glycosyltransferase involved in cell wall biosynthesis
MNNLLQNKRIAIVLTSLDLGGAERQALHLALYLKRVKSADVAIAALFGGLGDQPIRQFCIEHGLPCLRVNMPEHRASVPSFRSIRQFARDIAFLKPDILLPYTILPNVLCGITWQIAGAKVCIWNQRDGGLDLGKTGWHLAAMSNTRHFISNSRSGAAALTTNGAIDPRRIEVILNGVNLPPALRPSAVVRAEWGIAPEAFVGVMMANITRYKDHPTLIRAWRIVCDRLPSLNPTLLLAGRKDDIGQIQDLIASLHLSERVRLIGPVADVSSLLRAADMSVLSSISEGTPNAVLESMAAGRAVVATDLPGCRDALGENYFGLVPVGDASAMAEKMIELALKPELRKTIGEELHRRADAQFSLEQMCVRTCRSSETALASELNN